MVVLILIRLQRLYHRGTLVLLEEAFSLFLDELDAGLDSRELVLFPERDQAHAALSAFSSDFVHLHVVEMLVDLELRDYVVVDHDDPVLYRYLHIPWLVRDVGVEDRKLGRLRDQLHFLTD